MLRQRSHRDQLRANVRVRDAVSGTELGYLLDLSPNGLGVAGRGAAPAPEVNRLRLELPVRIRDRRWLEVPVEYRWHELRIGDRWHAGFRLRGVDDTDMALLEHLMTWYADP